MGYNPNAIGPKWQAYWEDNAVFRGKVDLTQGNKTPEGATTGAKA